jgi:hypothetical protein
MFSIWIKGIEDFLNLMPGGGKPMLINLSETVRYRKTAGYNNCVKIKPYLQSIVPSFSTSSISPLGIASPNVSSSHVRTSLAALGV